MSKIAPNVLIEGLTKTFRVQIIEAPTLWVVTYRDRPFNLKHLTPMNVAAPKHKYMKSQFSNPGFAKVLARRLNELFSTNDFEVKEITF